MEIKTASGIIFLVDDWAGPYISRFKWSISFSGNNKYATTQIRGRTVYAHRLVICALEGEIIDHINGNGLDNRLENLRVATRSQNSANRKEIKGKSGFRGVYFDKERNKFSAHCNYGGKHLHLGRYQTAEEAAKAYDRKAIEIWGEFARPNFPRSDA